MKNISFYTEKIKSNNWRLITGIQRTRSKKQEIGYREQETENRKDYNIETEYQQFISFYKRKSAYYDGLIEKYAGEQRSNILCVDYNEFINNPNDTFHNIVNFFGFNFSRSTITQFMKERKEKIHKHIKLDANMKEKIKRGLETI